MDERLVWVWVWEKQKRIRRGHFKRALESDHRADEERGNEMMVHGVTGASWNETSPDGGSARVLLSFSSLVPCAASSARVHKGKKKHGCTEN